MTIRLEELLALRIRTPHAFTAKDVMLYALGLGLGADDADLPYVYEDGLRTLPTFGGVLGYPGFWIKEHPHLGMDWRRVLNGEQSIRLHGPLPREGRVVGELRVTDVVDKGPGKDCLVYTVREVRAESDGAPVCDVMNTIVLRGHGGFGGPSARAGSPPAPPPRPDRAADRTADVDILRQAALIYRLSGDYNPLHADPAVARQAGFERPILHGAATWGIACCALVRELCAGDSARVRAFGARFSSPVYPGETLRTEAWTVAPGRAAFRCSVPARGKVVLESGDFEFDAG